MCSIRAITAGRISVGSYSPHPEQRDCHSGTGGVARSRSAVVKNGYNFTGENSYSPITHRNALGIITAMEQLQIDPKHKTIHVTHPIKLLAIFLYQFLLENFVFFQMKLSKNF